MTEGASRTSPRLFDGWSLPPGVPIGADDRNGSTTMDRGLVEVTVEPGGGRLRYPLWSDSALATLVAELREGRAVFEGGAEDVAGALGAVGARFLDPNDPLREEALSFLPAHAGLSSEMAAHVLDRMAADWTEPRLLSLLRAELGDPGVLDGFRERTLPTPGAVGAAAGEAAGEAGGRPRMVRAVGPELCFQICAGTVPGVSVAALIRGLLLRSAVVLKPAREDVVLPVLFHRALAEERPELAGLAAVAYWPGGDAVGRGAEGVGAEGAGPESFLLEVADTVVVYGSNEVVRAVRDRTPVTSRFVAYRHRVGAVMVGRDALSSGDSARAAADHVAEAVAAYDQRGCVSPHVVYLESTAEGAGAWLELLADALAHIEARSPTGPLLDSEASELQQIRAMGAMREAAGEEVRLRHGDEAPWTALLEPEAGFVPSCTGRVVRIRPVLDLDQAVDELTQVGPHLQTVALEGAGDRREELAERLAEIGASRVTRALDAPWPPPWWLHDGQGPLRALIRWTELEGT